MTVLTRATMAGPLRNGCERGGGTVVHLLLPREGYPALSGEALCGRRPSITWSDWAPEKMKICPRCERARKRMNPPESYSDIHDHGEHGLT